MNEKQIKDLLIDLYKDEGNFKQCEFTSFGGSSRPDFVILGDNYFKYFEIKTEKDNFNRVAGQLSQASGLFSHMIMVVPLNKVIKLKDQNWAGGIMTIEDLVEGKKDLYQEQKYPWRPTIDKVADVLWAAELRDFIKRVNPDIVVKDRWNGSKLTVARMGVDYLQRVFRLFYSDMDCYKILNEVLTTRIYNLRESRGNK